MKHLDLTSAKRNLLILLLAAGLMVLAAYTVSTDLPGASAQSSDYDLNGYAWSDTIGWISWRGTGYGISIDADGVMSGQGWSDNVGWVSADASDLSGCPSAPCQAYIDEDGVTRGWMRALSGGASQSGGWDGFISLSGTEYGPTRQSDGSFSGYAWGDAVIGWLSFAYTSTDFMAEPAAVLKVRKIGEEDWQDGLTIEPTEEIEIGWNLDSTANAESCEAVPPTKGFSTGGEVTGTDSDIEEPIGNTSNIYGLLCYGEGGSQKADTVTVTTNGGEGAQFCPGTEVGFVHRDTDVTLCWELGTNDPSMCSITAGGAAAVLSPLPDSNGTVTHRMLGEVTFTLECVGGDGDTMTVKVLPDVQET